MNYEQTIDYLYRKLPMFTRVGAVAFKKDLHNTIAMCERLDNPQNNFKTIHIGGTNGKGSTSHMLAAIFQQAGYKTGLYTSPHLKDFRERIRINGEMVSKDFVIDFVDQQQEIIEELSPSFFEVTVAMAFSYFSEQNVDIAIIEVGLGGRLDSTNIITPELSVITNISLDHTNILGNTLREIAGEKAGIIKPGIPVVIGESHPETDQVFIQKAKETQSLILFADKQLQISKSVKEDEYLKVSISQNGNVLIENLLLDLTGTYQLKNILTVIQAVETLRALDFKIDNDALYAALKEVKGLTGLMGRWQILSKNPLIVCDTGHNIAGITEVMQNINDTPHNKLHVVIGMVKDKDISGVLNLLPAKATYYFCQPQLERALPAQELASEAENHGLKGFVFPTVELAINAAKKNANADDLIYIGGSTFVVAEIP
ncbi:bifunctional folylpolyglutamate synthase/dihydrofolate synthase [Pedobacter panaciterrae]|mgnify:CR=1 FL=1|jgi:folylpolyglutamate synthase/dihydrofolate synthase|uniref:Dihydrofolate synthase/folylpolyglutamate synthase n=1 Tax=Pedobacter panaciterrae TaxID=363849 RepID=A0ABU8NUL7_9SPHI|nr:folylpolyglutamate synthase/dihydrofolate synthase family protein [Pedobacter panaciterrae]NQX52282.1 bifunctional folylpolyglutamate synthase/dihydrofolate synthase [Pedobacter panaciterrae]